MSIILVPSSQETNLSVQPTVYSYIFNQLIMKTGKNSGVYLQSIRLTSEKSRIIISMLENGEIKKESHVIVALGPFEENEYKVGVFEFNVRATTSQRPPYQWTFEFEFPEKVLVFDEEEYFASEFEKLQ